MRLRGLCAGLAGLLLAAGCASGQRPADEAAPAAVAENRSRIQATVLAVEPLDEHRFRLRLRVDEAKAVEGYDGFARPGLEIDAYPNFLRTEGAGVDYDREENRRLLAARDLPAGARVEAVVYRDGGGTPTWLLMEWLPLD